VTITIHAAVPEPEGAQTDGLTWQSYQANFCNFSM